MIQSKQITNQFVNDQSEKTSIVDNDTILISDSADSGKSKKIKKENLLADYLTNETGVEFLVDSIDNGGIEYIDGDGASWNTTTSIIGSSSGATATVRGTTGTTTGFLALTGIVGNFQVGETITSQQSPFKVSKVAQFKKQMVSVERVQSGCSIQEADGFC